MSKVFIEESTLSSIGNAIRNKTGKPGLIAPQDMATEINSVVGGASRSLANVLSKSTTPFTISKDELEGITRIGNYVCQNLTGLVGIEFPDSLERIDQQAFSGASLINLTLPENIQHIEGNAFENNSKLETVRINRTSSIITTNNTMFNNCGKISSIYVPSKLYSDYLKNGFWNNQYTQNKYIPYGEWVLASSFFDGYYSFNMTKDYTFELVDFKDTPSVSVSSLNPDVIEVSQAVVNADNTSLTITVRALEVEGESDITITIIGEEDTYSFNAKFNVMETLPESTYEVVAVEGATYGFVLNENGFYESTTKKIPSSYAICQVNISNLLNRRVYIDCISYGESNYDYGILSYPNEALELKSVLDGSSYFNFKGKSNPNIQSVEYTNASGECFIQIKFIKDGSGDSYNDSLQFKVRFEE